MYDRRGARNAPVSTDHVYLTVTPHRLIGREGAIMPVNTDTAALRSRIKLALLREACRRNLLTEAQLYELLQRQHAQ